jgi:hypothetical protein
MHPHGHVVLARGLALAMGKGMSSSPCKPCSLFEASEWLLTIHLIFAQTVGLQDEEDKSSRLLVFDILRCHSN